MKTKDDGYQAMADLLESACRVSNQAAMLGRMDVAALYADMAHGLRVALVAAGELPAEAR